MSSLAGLNGCFVRLTQGSVHAPRFAGDVHFTLGSAQVVPDGTPVLTFVKAADLRTKKSALSALS